MNQASLRGRAHRWLQAAVAGALITAGSPALAQKPADRLAAQKLLNEGNQAVGDGDYPKALAKFKEANQRFPSPKLLINIGTTQRLLGRYAEAGATYEAFLADPKADQVRVPEVTRLLKEIDALTGHVKLVCNEPDAKVRLDGQEVQKFASGMVVRVDPGEHTAVAEKAGLPPAVRTMKLGPGEERAAELELKPAEKVVVDRVVVGPQRNIGIAVGSVGAAGLVAGLAVGGVALAKKGAIAGHCYPRSTACDQEGVDLAASTRTFGTASTGLLIAGGGVLVTGLVLFLTAPSGAPPKGTGGVPAGPSLAGLDGFVGRSGAGASMRGVW